MSKPKTITEMVSEVEQFFAGRGSSWDDPKWSWRKLTYQPGSDNSRMKEDKATTPSTPSIPPRKTENTPATPTASWAGDARYWADRTCYYCRKPGHIARQCPEKMTRIGVLDIDARRYPIQVTVGGKVVTMFLDSAADVSVVPPEFITQEDYTGEITLVKGVNGQGCLPIANTTITAALEEDSACLGEGWISITGVGFPRFQHTHVRGNQEDGSREGETLQ